jgi:NAD+ kinase
LKKFGITGHSKRTNVGRTARLIIELLKQDNLEYCVCEDVAELIGDSEHLVLRSEMWKQIDCLLALGGDGTMLSAARTVALHGVPIFGINVGNLGFLTEITANEIPDALTKIRNDDYKLEERMVLEAAITNGDNNIYFALNDVVLDNGGDSRLVKLDLYQGEQFVCSYNADGLIIATPTGSTAYNLAAGGPVLYPQLGALIASPICPHSLTLRPIVFDENSLLNIKVADEDIHARLTVDGQISMTLKPGAEVLVKKAAHKVKLIRIKKYAFFEILRTKLHLGARPLSSDNA